VTLGEDANKSVVDWIGTAAIPLGSVEPRLGYRDMERFRAIVGDARIVSLGEQTHGTREFRKLMHRVFEFCVAEMGFTVLGIEAPFPDSLAVNAYVLDGTGNAADALAGTRYWIWDTEEVLDLIEWMRWWNARNARKVKFYGFVTDYADVAALGLIDFLARVAPDLAAECRTTLAPLTSDFTAGLLGQLADARREDMFACLAKVSAAFVQERSRWAAATSALDWHVGRLNAKVLDQAARFEINRRYTSHDRVMAENVCALLEAEGPDAKAVLLSHNDHASRVTDDDGKSMGGYLDEMVGRAQRVIGTSFDRGAFRARGYPAGELKDHTVSAAPSGSFDAVLAQARLPLFALDLANAPREGAAAAWLASEMAMRHIGGIYGFPSDNKLGVTYTGMLRPRERLDAVMFVAETTATRPSNPEIPRPAPVVLSAPSNLELSGDGVPPGWRLGGIARRYAPAAAVSDCPSPRGGRTVRLSRDAPWRWGDGRLVQRISAQAFRGQRLRFAAAVRTEATRSGAGALLYLQFLAKPDEGESLFFGAPLATAASSAEPVQSPHWTTLAVEADVPETADTFVIGLVVTSNGAVWFGDLELAAIGRPD
jgi:erythromycin esterase